jgi:hypothetical protein
MRAKFIALAAVAAAVALASPATAGARSCGGYESLDSGATVDVDAYYSATCSFASAAARRFYAVDGVPRRMIVLGTVLTRRATRHPSGGTTFWLYDGRRHGRYASVIITEEDGPAVAPAAPSLPSSPPPGNGYPVVCNDGTVSTSGGIQGACSHHGGVSG